MDGCRRKGTAPFERRLGGSRRQTPTAVHENGEEYGYQLWPHSADHTYMFNGMFGQYVVVAPDLDLVLAVNAGAGNLFTRKPQLHRCERIF